MHPLIQLMTNNSVLYWPLHPYTTFCKDLYEPKDNSAAERYKNIIILLSIFVEIKLNKLDELSYKPENTSIEIPIDK